MDRTREPEIVAHNREERRQEFELAERLLNAGWMSATNTQVEHPGGDRRAGLIMRGLYAKILNNLLSIIVLEERGLPTGSTTREMTEAMINLAYIATDPSPLSELYVDGVVLRDQRNLNRRRNSEDREIRSGVSEEEERLLREMLDDIEQRRGKDELKRMRDPCLWKSWAGPSIEGMAKKADLPPIVYEGAYALDSRSVHAMDVADFLGIDKDGNVSLLLAAGSTMKHLMPGIVVALVAFEIVNRTFKLGRDAAVRDLDQQVRKLNEKRAIKS
jgi:hypothetical protein